MFPAVSFGHCCTNYCSTWYFNNDLGHCYTNSVPYHCTSVFQQLPGFPVLRNNDSGHTSYLRSRKTATDKHSRAHNVFFTSARAWKTPTNSVPSSRKDIASPLVCKYQLFNSVLGNGRFLFWESFGIHKYTLRTQNVEFVNVKVGGM